MIAESYDEFQDDMEFNRVCDAFEVAWKAGNPPDINDYVMNAPERLRSRLRDELILLNEEYRAKQETWSLATVNTPPEISGDVLKVGATWQGYEILKELGSGGQAVTYLAHDLFHRKVVIKKWHSESVSNPEDILEEGKKLAKLEHPNLPVVYTASVWKGQCYIVMEYIQGCTLNQWIDKQEPNWSERRFVAEALVRTIAWLHEHGLAHLDLKPSNILVKEPNPQDRRSAPQIKIIDLGLAQWYSAWSPAGEGFGGTLGYMAPEIAVNWLPELQPDDASPKQPNLKRADVYSLGCLLFYLLTRKSPLELRTNETKLPPQERLVALARRIVSGDLNWGALANCRGREKAYIPLCKRAMSLQPEARPTANEFHRDLQLLRWARVAIPLVVLFFVVGIATWFIPWGMETSPLEPNLKLLVQRMLAPDTEFVDLSDLLPLNDTDRLRLQLEIPTQHSAALYVVNSEGVIRRDASWPRGEGGTYEYPDSQEGRVIPLLPPHGTEFYFVCVSRSRTIPEGVVEQTWRNANQHGGLPPLKGATFRVSGKGIDQEDKSPDAKEIGQAVVDTSTLGQIRRRLDSFRTELKRQKILINGKTFPHFSTI